MNLCLWSIFPHVTFYQYILLSSIHDRHNTFTSVLKHPPPHRRRIHLAIYLSIVTVFFFLLSFMFLVYICWDVCVSVRQYIYIFSSILRCRPNQMCLIFVVVVARTCVCVIYFFSLSLILCCFMSSSLPRAPPPSSLCYQPTYFSNLFVFISLFCSISCFIR